MGCMSTKQSDISSPSQFKTNQKISQSIYIPQYSYLYNVLRKRSQVQIIRNINITQSLFIGELIIQIESQKVKINDIKLLCNFKNVILVGFNRQSAQIIKNYTTPKAIYLLTLQQSKQFLLQFPIFSSISSSSKIQPKYLPILAFNQQQLIRNTNTNKQQNKRIIFLHSQKYKNQSIYNKLKIDYIIKQSQYKDKYKNNKQIINEIRKKEYKKILYLHNKDKKQQQLLQILNGFIWDQYQINQINGKIYFTNILPQTKHNQLQHIPKTTALIPSQIPTQSLTQNFMTCFIKLQSEIISTAVSSQIAASKVQRAYNLLITLISNIYTNKQSDNFRKVRKTNKQINDLLGKYQTGIKLLKDVGFVDESGWYVNNTDGKYLKLFRMDLEVGYRQYIQRESIKK